VEWANRQRRAPAGPLEGGIHGSEKKDHELEAREKDTFISSGDGRRAQIVNGLGKSEGPVSLRHNRGRAFAPLGRGGFVQLFAKRGRNEKQKKVANRDE